MCRGRDMGVMVMDVEGTDGRERGEDQVRRCFLHVLMSRNILSISRILNGNLPSSRWRPLKSSSLISGNTKSVFTKAPTWLCSRLYSRSTSVCSERGLVTGKWQGSQFFFSNSFKITQDK